MTTLFTRKPQTTTRAVGQPPTTTDWPEDVIARFRTRGGATVDLYRHAWTERHYGINKEVTFDYDRTGFEWACRGCGMTGAEQHLRVGDAGYPDSELRDARKDANTHAQTCHSMPRPQNR